jgi:lysine-N-methylase
MKVLKPFYYDKFKCIGNQCEDSCCIGWKVYIDKKSYVKYKKVKGEFGKKLNCGISRNRSNETYLKYGEMNLRDERCEFLNDKNLCDVYINLGEEYLCNTCKQYPRVLYKFGNIIEKTLNLSCPEVTRIFVESNETFSFNMENEELSDTEKQFIQDVKYNNDLYNLLWKGRDLSIEVAQFREIDIWKRLVFIKIIGEKLQQLINESNYNQLENTIEELKNTITSFEVISSLDNISKVNTVKIAFIKVLLQRKVNIGESNKVFNEILNDFNLIFEDNKKASLILEKKESEFNIYLKEYEYIFENYIVYSLYNNYIQTLNSKDLNKIILILTLSYSTIKMLLLAKWIKNNEILIKEDIIDVLYSFSRVTEHNNIFMECLYKDLKKEGYDSLAYLTILVR